MTGPDDVEDDRTEGVSQSSAAAARRSAAPVDPADRPCQTRPSVRARSIVLVGAAALVAARRCWRRSCGDDGPGDTATLLRRGPGPHAPSCSTRAGDARRHRRRSSTSTGASATSRRWPSSRTGRRWCSTTRRRAPSTRPTRSRCSGRWRRPTRPSESAVAVHDCLLANCNVDLGPVATIVPHAPPPAPPPTTVAG